MFKKIILFLILLIVTPIIARASFFDDLLKNIDHTLNNRTFDNTAITPENKIEDNVNINTDVSSQDNCFLSPLEVGNENNDVWKLQEFLSTLPNIYPEKLVTGYFGNLTKQAVMRFQLKYKKDILEPVGLLKPTGYVGQSTLKKLNQLNSC